MPKSTGQAAGPSGSAMAVEPPPTERRNMLTYKRKSQKPNLNTEFKARDPYEGVPLQLNPGGLGFVKQSDKSADARGYHSTGGVPYYMQNKQPPSDQLLASMQSVISSLSAGQFTRKAWNEQLDYQTNVGSLLLMFSPLFASPTMASKCEKRHLPAGTDGRVVFKRPFITQDKKKSVKSVCMCLDKHKVKAQQPQLIKRTARGYFQVVLGYSNGQAITEFAHRLVLHAAFGPPPNYPESHDATADELPPKPKDQALHMCGRKACINPEHLVWGSKYDNQQDQAGLYRQLLKVQSRTQKGYDDIFDRQANKKPRKKKVYHQKNLKKKLPQSSGASQAGPSSR